MATPVRDVLVDTLEEQRKHLDFERDKFTQAALDLGREKAALEVRVLVWVACLLYSCDIHPGRTSEIP
jgi:hypothetical protein